MKSVLEVEMKNKKRIVIIDDDSEVISLLKHFFEQQNYETICFLEPLKAYEEIASGRAICDVIITDQSLPNMTGIDFTKKMKTLGNQTPIILITGSACLEVSIQAIRAGAYDFVVKPIHLAQILVSVERAIYLRKIEDDNRILKNVVKLQEGPLIIEGLVSKSKEMLLTIDLVRRVAKSNSNVLISGESGTGKELIAKAIHNLGSRKKFPFLAINCSAIPENLLESELFGHAKGAFTGAIDKKIGLFEEADSGTLFLDEIGDLNIQLQAKLLRVLQERKIRRVGENQDRPVRARIISATHKNLRDEVDKKNFREDLFFRLNVIPVWIPPLRSRKDDIVPLAEFFLKKYSALNGLTSKYFSKECMTAMVSHKWQGNVRELENSIERALVLSEQEMIDASDVISVDQSDTRSEDSQVDFSFSKIIGNKIISIEELVNLYVLYVLNLNNGLKEKTAKDLNIDRKTLYRRIRESNLPHLLPD